MTTHRGGSDEIAIETVTNHHQSVMTRDLCHHGQGEEETDTAIGTITILVVVSGAGVDLGRATGGSEIDQTMRTRRRNSREIVDVIAVILRKAIASVIVLRKRAMEKNRMAVAKGWRKYVPRYGHIINMAQLCQGER